MMYTVEQIMQAIDTLDHPERERLMRALSSQNGGQQAEDPSSACTIDPSVLSGPDFVLVYDGGDEERVGAFALAARHDAIHAVTQVARFDGALGHEAEYQVLIAGLQHLHGEICRQNEHPSKFDVEIRGDSRLVTQQLLGYWKTGSPQLQQRRNEARSLLDGFASFRMTEIPSSQVHAILSQ